MSRPTIAFTALLLAFTTSSTAAPVPVGPKAGNDPIPFATARLLKFRHVQRELKMTAEQRIKLLDTLEDIEEDYEKQLSALEKNLNTPEEAYEKLDKEHTKLVEKTMATTLDKELTAAQRLRFQQFGWQFEGPAAFADEVVQKKLQLTEAQKAAAKELAEEATGLHSRYFDAEGSPDEDKVRQEIIEFRREKAKKFVDGLTADQQDVWKVLIGEPIKSFDVTDFWLKHGDSSELFQPPKP